MEDEFAVGSASQPGTASGGDGAATAQAGTGAGGNTSAGSGGAGGVSGAGSSGNNGGGSAPSGNGGSAALQPGTGGTDVSGPATGGCFDATMNGTETGVDCGGPCEACGCDGTFDPPELLTGFGLEPMLWGPMPSSDDGTLYFSHQDESGVEDIYRATRSDRGSVFSPATIHEIINSSQAQDGTPYVTPNGLELYLFSKRANGLGDRDLYISTRNTTADDFSTPVPVGNVNSDKIDYLPWLAPDRLSLYFVSTRTPGGQGASDIWVARRGTQTDQWTTPSNVSELNTSARDEGITLSRDGLTAIFASNRDNGEGEVDLWLALRTSLDAPFSEPVNLSEVNSDDDEVDPHLSNDGHELFFSSNRNGEQLLYRAWRDCP